MQQSTAVKIFLSQALGSLIRIVDDKIQPTALLAFRFLVAAQVLDIMKNGPRTDGENASNLED